MCDISVEVPKLIRALETTARSTEFANLLNRFRLVQTKMKEAIVQGTSGTEVQIVDSPIPTPEATQVVIKVVVSGTNPKDWKRPH